VTDVRLQLLRHVRSDWHIPLSLYFSLMSLPFIPLDASHLLFDRRKEFCLG
jgi:hypothetical protein